MDIVMKLGILMLVLYFIYNSFNIIKMNRSNEKRDKFMLEQYTKLHNEMIDSLENTVHILKTQIRYRDTLIFNNSIEKTNIIHEMDAQIAHVVNPSYTKDSIRLFFANNYR